MLSLEAGKDADFVIWNAKLLENGKIMAIGGADFPSPRAAKVVDLTGNTSTPGLIDATSRNTRA